jgi:hypothetical protein
MDCCSSATPQRRGLSVRTIIMLVAVVLTIGILVLAGCADRGSGSGSHGGGHGGHSGHSH